ncbi:signal recognition particle receptor subunit alpha-like protein [Dinothrombium tinctorium]|uniref:Signal recognition particle receptor subunit alpha-like protein n=1 Tax=Dinothrombium tinctorium TaxID=1965070 RepID=A0A3S3PG68_9ACAR|nr:signal recognition particle receptor subunit alpha-like protein [Dinothrombium tinctorium]RWS11773.1 signal recognition particle receptor subunit alpha-like protein [Dinothrombium tinctorium]
MLDFFVIFTKSGIVLFTTVNQAFNGVINRLIKHVILEERRERFTCDQLALEYRLDNEWELVFVVGYQKMLSLSYVDKFLDDVQLAFRDKFNVFDLRKYLMMKENVAVNRSNEELLPSYNVVDFFTEYNRIYNKCCKYQQNAPQKEMKTFQQSAKSQKTVASLYQTSQKEVISFEKAKEKLKKEAETLPVVTGSEKQEERSPKPGMNEKLKKLMAKGQSSPKVAKNKEKTKKTKEARQWELGGKSTENLDFSKKETNGETSSSVVKNIAANVVNGDSNMEADVNLELESGESEEEEVAEEVDQKKGTKKSLFGSFIKTFSYNKALEKSDLDPILSQLRDHLIAKNVATEIAVKLCESVGTKLEGQQVNTWLGLKSFVRKALEDSMLRILSPNRNINILREIRAKAYPPYVIVFCGVNGVGKSTNLAKISNWLILNGLKVLVIACDTFRAGAIEQLRTHVTALKAIHEKDGQTKIDLYEKGYGRDSAAIAMEAINYARNTGYNCCLVDTAGRMQDNEPLMKQLAKLIKINEPDLTLFVGEALVGNEAVDQLCKFNTALIDNGCKGTNDNSSAINGIVLTKFDTIDDQVGAAISMTYITGQPIVFVGVGQTYRDLKQLNAKAVVKALMK